MRNQSIAAITRILLIPVLLLLVNQASAQSIKHKSSDFEGHWKVSTMELKDGGGRIEFPQLKDFAPELYGDLYLTKGNFTLELDGKTTRGTWVYENGQLTLVREDGQKVMYPISSMSKKEFVGEFGFSAGNPEDPSMQSVVLVRFAKKTGSGL